MMDLVASVKTFLEENPTPFPVTLSNALSDLTSEVGELHKAHLIATDWGSTTIDDTHYGREAFFDEYSDVLYQLLSVGVQAGLTTDEELERCLTRTLNKFKHRIAKHGHMGSSAYLSTDPQ